MQCQETTTTRTCLGCSGCCLKSVALLGRGLVDGVVFVPFFITPWVRPGAGAVCWLFNLFLSDPLAAPVLFLFASFLNSTNLRSTDFCWADPEVTLFCGSFEGILDGSGLLNLSWTGASRDLPDVFFCTEGFEDTEDFNLGSDFGLSFCKLSDCRAWLCWDGLDDDDVTFDTEVLTCLLAFEEGWASLDNWARSKVLWSEVACFGWSRLDSTAAATKKSQHHCYHDIVRIM